MPEVFIFNHLPRTGGLTFSTVLEQWFDPVFDYQSDASDEARRQWIAQPVDLGALRKGQVLIGHYTGDARIDLRYPGVFNERFALLTLLRTPWDAAKSALQSGAARHLLEYASFHDAARSLAGSMGRALQSPPLSVKQALERYWFVGTTERLEQSIRLLAARLGFPVPVIPRTNTGPSVAATTTTAPTTSFLNAAHQDFALHAMATARLEQEM